MNEKEIEKQMKSFSVKDTVMNEKEKEILKNGDIGQGERLNNAKKKGK